jgi:hypothetical protein
VSVLPLKRIVVAALAATALLGSAAQANASTQLVNAGTVEFGPPALVMDVAQDGNLFLENPNGASFRQKFDKESAGNGRFRYRNPATNACLTVRAQARPGDNLRVGACNGVGTLNQWTLKDIAPGNNARMLVSVSSGLVPVPNFFAFPSNLLKLQTLPNASSLGSFAEYIGA